MTRAALAEQLRRHAFPPVRERPRIGVEAELLALDATTGRVVDVGNRLLPFLRGYGARHGWRECPSPKGAPRFELTPGGAITLEPGGQLEYATPPHTSPAAVLHDVARVVPALVRAAADGGITLIGRGIDPNNPLEEAPLQVDAPRYRMMDAYFASIGSAGARMMRQTAALQVNIDAATDPALTWRVLNAAAPFLTAIFANATRYAGVETAGSARAMMWRALDPLRTGVLPCTGDVADEYAGFALWAPAMFLPTPEGEYLPYCEWVRRGGTTDAMLADHLTTLFPEVRPKGYFEVRSIDALPPEQYAAPVLTIAGLTLDVRALAEADALLGDPDPATLERASRLGLSDPLIAGKARQLYQIAMDGCRRQGDAVCGGEAMERAADYQAAIFNGLTD